jgi:aromatic ring-cleaving dioxygenase
LVFNAKFASPVIPEGGGAKFASPEGVNGQESIGAKRLRRFYLQAVARELLPNARVAECTRAWIPGVGVINIHYSQKFKRAHYGNLVQCASVWVCPVCASKITERRRVELEGALAKSPWAAVMVTLTFQHTREDKLVDLVRDMSKAHARLKSGKGWLLFRKRWGLVGEVTSTEVTYGLENGWHFHKHCLYLVDHANPDTEAIREDISKRFTAVMGKLGRYVHPEIGVHVRATTPTAADYISKWGAAFEVTKAAVKKGVAGEHYNPFELLALCAEGVDWAGAKFQEYAAAMKGISQLRWSPGLRRLLAMGEQPTDAELVEAPEEADIILAQLTLPQWREVLKQEKRGELLEVASTGDPIILVHYLEAIGIRVGWLDTYAGLRISGAPPFG